MAYTYNASSLLITKLASFSLWSWFYIWCMEKLPGHNPEWYSRGVTLLHGTVATFVGIKQCCICSISNAHAHHKVAMTVTPVQYCLMIWSWGYFAFDLLWCCIYWPHNYVILCHHLIALIAVNFYMNKIQMGCTFACTLALMEVTNPLLQIRWFLRDGGLNNTFIYYFVEVTYLLLFLFLRGIICSFLMYKVLRSEVFDIEEKFISIALYVISMALVYEIIGYVLYKYKHKINEFKGFANEVRAILNETMYNIKGTSKSNPNIFCWHRTSAFVKTTALFHRTLNIQSKGRKVMLPPPIRCYGLEIPMNFQNQENVVQQFSEMTERMRQDNPQSMHNPIQRNEMNDKLVVDSLQRNWSHRHHPYRFKDKLHTRDEFGHGDNRNDYKDHNNKHSNNWRDRRNQRNRRRD